VVLRNILRSVLNFVYGTFTLYGQPFQVVLLPSTVPVIVCPVTPRTAKTLNSLTRAQRHKIFRVFARHQVAFGVFAIPGLGFSFRMNPSGWILQDESFRMNPLSLTAYLGNLVDFFSSGYIRCFSSPGAPPALRAEIQNYKHQIPNNIKNQIFKCSKPVFQQAGCFEF